jgi:hypothetical protein
MPQPDDFPPMVFMGVDNKPGARIASIRELTPMSHRPPDRVWVECFGIECRQSAAIDWSEGDFSKCRTGGETRVIDALRKATTAADARFVEHLRHAQPDRVSDIVTLEMFSEKSVGTDGPYMSPSARPIVPTEAIRHHTRGPDQMSETLARCRSLNHRASTPSAAREPN